LVKKEAAGGQYYYLYNGYGDVVQIVDTNGNVVNSYQYDEWGNILNQNETISNSFKYAGEQYDSETGLYYLRARYCDPNVGRFINKDTYEGDTRAKR
jgi:RHS repeat-associated protein